MSLTDVSPSSRALAPELYADRDRDGGGTRLRAAHVRDGVVSTFVVPGDWPEHAERWHADGLTTYSTKDGNAIEFYTDGQSALSAMVEAIATATGPGHIVFLLGWTCFDDFQVTPAGDPRAGALAGMTMREILMARARAGVSVRVLLWDSFYITPVTTIGTSGFVIPTGFAAADATRHALDRAAGDMRCVVDCSTRLYGSHHQKVLVVAGEDGLVGFYGGVDVNPDRVGPDRMHDVHARVRGPAAADLLALARTRWANQVPTESVGGTEELRALFDREPTPAEDGDVDTDEVGTTRVKIVQTVGNPIIARLRSPPQYTDAWPSIAHALRRARRFVYLEDQYFWSLDAARELADALSNIAHLTILLPLGESASSGPAETWAEQVTMDLISAADLRHAALAALFQEAGAHRHKIGVYQRTVAPQYIHSKTWIIDDEVAIVGSANCNRRGYSHDSEVAGVSIDRIGAPWHRLEFTSAHALRMRLWADHLGMHGAQLVDGVGAGVYWRRPPDSARITGYMVPGRPHASPIDAWARDHVGVPFPDSWFLDPA